MKKQLLATIADQQVQINNLKKFNLVNKTFEVNDDFTKVKKDRDYEYLVFSGGGIKGLSFVGALEELNNMGILYDANKKLKIKGIAASSAGSIIGTLLAFYTVDELVVKMSAINFEDLVDDKIGYIRDAYNFISKYGVCRGEYIYNLMGELIAEKTGNPDYTLKDLYKDKKFKLIITTTNQNEKKTIYLNALHAEEIYSNIPIRTCVRMSISVPFLFEPFEYNNCLFSDGGVLDNYPIHCFDVDDPNDVEAIYYDTTPNFKTLGLKITSHEKKNVCKIDHLYDYACSYIETFLKENDRKTYIKENYIRTIFITTPNYPLTKFDLTDEEKKALPISGKNGVIRYFKE